MKVCFMTVVCFSVNFCLNAQSQPDTLSSDTNRERNIREEEAIKHAFFKHDEHTLDELTTELLAQVKQKKPLDEIYSNQSFRAEEKSLMGSDYEMKEEIYRSAEETREGTSEKIIPRSAEEESEETSGGRLQGPTPFDSRIEIRGLNPMVDWQRQVLENARSVGIIVHKETLHLVSDSVYQIDVVLTLRQKFNLCSGESFENQPVMGIGTAFIIGDRLLATAAHVLDGPPDQYAVIFGFEMYNQLDAFETLIPAGNVYFPLKIVGAANDLDIAVFETDRMPDKPALRIPDVTVLPEQTEVYMIGHPLGLPKKVALNAGVLNNRHPNYFYSSLDAFQGNSGSPVFNRDTHELIGLLVSGETDFQWTGTCNISKICGPPYCAGEKVMRIQEIEDIRK